MEDTYVMDYEKARITGLQNIEMWRGLSHELELLRTLELSQMQFKEGQDSLWRMGRAPRYLTKIFR
ncbi:hypothetical protein KIN20_007442 [Parelaphostrongylus tenuis]|uniref:Uncharacterized protein n=1 Tax=Parelaphostrongylus tenuis TaxID=148309 RepID=A0AAD5MM90_PARTN|nr:hypothetical protein KIN20_007442 [Parelaphostrongylus tenuis]